MNLRLTILMQKERGLMWIRQLDVVPSREYGAASFRENAGIHLNC
jgi:hypothetical protein